MKPAEFFFLKDTPMLPSWKNFVADLRKDFAGDIRNDLASRAAVQHGRLDLPDRAPGRLHPRTQEDLQAAVELAAKYGIPILAAGLRFSLAGQAMGGR